jgi:hypothetical protein
VDVSFHNVEGETADTPYRERTTFNPFGPVDNGSQVLYGLDYRTAAWRGDEENPFHTEVGYWLWDAGARQVMRCFMVPRGSTILAIGTADPDARQFTMTARVGSETDGILSNPYLDRAARATDYEVTVTLSEDGQEFSYDETTTLTLSRVPGPQRHTDRNTLRRVE